MKNGIRLLSIFILTTLSFNSIGQNITPEWVLTYGGTFIDRATCVVIDNNDDVVLLGFFGDSVDFDPTVSTNYIEAKGWTDPVIQKVDGSGVVQWTKSIGNDVGGLAGADMITDLSGNIYITGSFSDSVDFDPGAGTSYKLSNGQNDNFVLKLDMNGDFVWVKTYGSSNSEISHSITNDLDNNILVTGKFSGTCDFDPGVGSFTITANGNDSYVLKLSEDGNFIWVKNVGGTGFILGREISTDLDKNIFVAGKFSDTVDFDPGVGVYNVSAMNTYYNAYVVKLDSSGEFLWVNHYGRDITGLENDALGNVLVFGAFSGLVDFGNGAGNDTISSIGYSGFVQKLDPNGINIWVKAIQTDDIIIPSDLHLSSSNDIYITGGFQGVTDFNPSLVNEFIDSTGGNTDAFILKISNNGDFLWQKSLKGGQGELGHSISTDMNDGVYLAGEFYLDCDFGGGIGALNSQGESDMFLMKIGATASVIDVGVFNSSVRAFPNPTSGELIIRFDKNIDSELSIYDQLGQLLESKQISGLNTMIDLTNYATGIYTLHILNNEGSGIIKIAKQ